MLTATANLNAGATGLPRPAATLGTVSPSTAAVIARTRSRRCSTFDAASACFAQHGCAKLYLDQVLAKKEFLKA